MKVNINDIVTVTLTRMGASIINADRIKFNLDAKYKEGDEYKCSLWSLMNIFGSYLYLEAREVPFKDCIIIF